MLKVWNYGGGVQSIAIACLIRAGELPRPDVAIFADTGDEPDEVYAWNEYMRPLLPCELRIVKRDGPSISEHVMERVAAGRRIDNPPFWVRGNDGREACIRRDCTSEWKIVPITKEIKKLLGLKPRGHWPRDVVVEQWLGISGDEVGRMKSSVDPWLRWWHPLVETQWSDDGFWKPRFRRHPITRKACVSIIHTTMREENWTTPPTPGPPKSACRQCPFRSNANWRRIRDHEPHNWQKNVELDRALRSGPGGVIHGMDRPVYLHRSLAPLDEADLDANIGSAMDEECAGICGV